MSPLQRQLRAQTGPYRLDWFEKIAYMLCAIALTGIFVTVILNAIPKEQQFNQQRLCKYYANELNANALAKGKIPPCL